MNTAVRVASVSSSNVFGRRLLMLPVLEMRVFILLIAILLSALVLIYVKDLGRRLFINYQDVTQTTQILTVQHDKLMLEESAFASPARVQEIAFQQWNMKLPTQADVVLVEAP